MTEPENFEEDLFADLYNDEDDSSKPTEPVPEIKPEPPVVNGSKEAKAEDAIREDEQNQDGDHHMYNNEQDGDDEIDFNLGNGNEYRESPAQQGGHGPGIKEDG